MDLVIHHKKRYTCAHSTPVLSENFLLAPLFKSLLGLLIEMLHVNSYCPACIFWGDS